MARSAFAASAAADIAFCGGGGIGGRQLEDEDGPLPGSASALIRLGGGGHGGGHGGLGVQEGAIGGGGHRGAIGPGAVVSGTDSELTRVQSSSS